MEKKNPVGHENKQDTAFAEHTDVEKLSISAGNQTPHQVFKLVVESIYRPEQTAYNDKYIFFSFRFCFPNN